MINDAKNKMVNGPSTVRAVSVIKNEYFFAGSGVWKPLNIIASTIEEATAAWEQKREPIEPARQEKKVEVKEEAKENV